ncbi:MAG: hypothetical protein Kow00105_19280 [Phycisphaeraceae bacterium]
MSAIASKEADANTRSEFAADELAIVLSHYRVGLIDTIKPFKRGSRKSPKLIIRSDTGLYLLKRRAHGRDDPFKVAFTHGIQIRLAEKGFPLPKLIGTRRENNSMVQFRGSVYELFEFVRGSEYDGSAEATHDAGATLARFHSLLADYQPHYQPPRGTYHKARVVHESLSSLPAALTQAPENPLNEAEARPISDKLHEYYQRAEDFGESLGIRDWPAQIGHSDWHPGNMLFEGAKVVSVIDYDSARLMPRIIDIANGALQFSVQRNGEQVAGWPDEPDLARYRAFLQGYESVSATPLTQAERRAIPALMIEALIAESVIPVAVTGRFAQIPGGPFLNMVARKAEWLERHTEQLIEFADTES